ncbi:thiol reductase thioredoxin [Virgibacillus phasianinus]|uniref:Thiol reductase thioredoxin n=1 Tax=Virgibacillus phasianinus TaxID=2017483 RepID=A0A220U509_9BACI|nr:thioredoxin family protein [Virgibacillus phasianinus]ASK62813.1 thiol reductase thioredoxin [Virgibacillus phasianinus]
MQQVSEQQLNQDHYFLYIYTPFCGTCQLAKSMLTKIESVHRENIFLEMNASLHPEFMQKAQIESVPCLLIKDGNQVKEKIYAFQSIPNIYSYLMKYEPGLFAT